MKKDGTFTLSIGSEFPLPAKYDIRESHRKDSLTPLIISTYKKKGQKTCHFAQTPELMEYSERVGIFVPRGVKPGDILRIMWIGKGNACAIPVELLKPGKVFVSWLYETDCSCELSKLGWNELGDLVKRQTELIPMVGIQPGCAIVIPELDIYSCRWKTEHKVSGVIIVTDIDSGKEEDDVSFAGGLGRQPGYVRLGKDGYIPATETQIRELVRSCFSGKWAFM